MFLILGDLDMKRKYFQLSVKYLKLREKLFDIYHFFSPSSILILRQINNALTGMKITLLYLKM